ncbi:LacI family DNA-binding transcriptional regulator [Anaerolentibacter hominis]|uniref:LacI family DNA-binding transcriptional regulator n=1 Tax=Anaerolentibacter hominis TaxID=3079009 RepID=UPI0031B8AC19
MKISIRKLSEQTGYSPATISNALNRKKGVNKETAEKIFKAAAQMGYVNEKRIRKIKFVIFKRNGKIIENTPFFPAVMEGVEQKARSLGFETIFCRLEKEQEDFKEQLNQILTDTSAAVILLGSEMMEEDFQLFAHPDCPLILLDGWSDTVAFDSVLINNTDSACQAVNYLIQCGHERIGYLKADFRIKAFNYREIGLERALTDHNLPIVPEYKVTLGPAVETAYLGMKNFLQHTTKQELPTAYFADNDVIALGAIRALQEEGIRVPEDVSVIGFDNLPFCEISNPRLTTIHVYKQEMGEMAVKRLVDRLENGSKVKAKIQVCTEFVERESVKVIKK